MSLPHALLTSLLEQACSGLELARRFDRSIGFFWQATHQQIYRELARLEAAGWIASLPPESGRGRKKVYRVLPAGRRELKRWTGEAQTVKPLRDDFLVRVRAEAVIGPTALDRELRQRLAHHREQLATYLALEAKDFAGPTPSRETRLQHQILKAGIMYERFRVEWCEQALQLLED